jgi:hypothetical protein
MIYYLAPTGGKILRFLAQIGRRAGITFADYQSLFAPKNVLFD